MQLRTTLAIVSANVLGLCSLAGASIIGTSGQMVEIAPPPDVRLGALERNTLIRVFAERQNVALASNLSVDITQPGTVPIGSVNLTPGVIPAGTRVDSYLIHFDPVGIPAQSISPSGSSSGVTFSTPVLGIEVLSANLDNTDATLGAPSTIYPVGETLRGLELAVGQIGINTFDGINLSPDRKTVFVILSTQLSLDHVRIITAVPEPSSLAMLIGAGIAGALAYVCRRTHLGSLHRVMGGRTACRALICILALAGATATAKADFVFTHNGDTDPTTEGFTADLSFFGTPSTAAAINDDLGIPAWSVTGGDVSSQGGYAVPFDEAQFSNVLNNGFTLTLIARPVLHVAPVSELSNGVYSIVSTAVHLVDRRFDINLGINAAGDIVVGLPNDIVPGADGGIAVGETYTLNGQGTGYHTYSLVYDPEAHTADLLLDGIERLTDYPGGTDFLSPIPGFAFGATNGGQANFNFVQFTSVPEPSSLVMIGIGGLGFAANCRYRRRCRRRVAKTSRYFVTCVVTHFVGRRLGSRRLPAFAMLAAALCCVPFGRATADTVTYSDFSSTSGLVLNGNAAAISTADGDVLRLVPALNEQVGSFYTQQPVIVTNFSTSFEFRLTNPGGFTDVSGQTGADGIGFVVQSVGNTALGENGGGQGYAGIGQSVGVEFDTWTNSWDLDSNHVGIAVNGDTILGSAPVAPLFDDGNKWYAWIDYDGSMLEVRTNQTGVRPLTANFSALVDVPALVGGSTAFVGFSAATFSAFENHDILSWNFVSVPEPSSVLLFALGMSALLIGRLRKVSSSIRR